jgi:hypothetical protein
MIISSYGQTAAARDLFYAGKSAVAAGLHVFPRKQTTVKELSGQR